ncbi:hypothetical protein BCON_0009g00570 [Botryotinia convoluta]|uniref:Uncharacterized protein n=1 Tax=Botryotinia convoluta TaxID=54673 RepID=A0A4Z1IRH4_9HELO|nr:hypothetical protein BCON_0009g00570 [Botryotinia convoluta]
MAPMRDQPEEYMNRLVQRNVMLDDLQLAKRDGRGNDNGNGNGRNGERNDDYSDERSDDHQDKQVDGSQMPTPVVTRTAWTQITNTAWTTQTATAWTTQTAITTSSSVMTVVVVATPSSTSTSASSTSTSISITSATSSLPTGAVTFSIPSSEQPGRKGLCTLSNGAPCESPTATTSTVTAYEAISASSAPTAQADEDGSSPSDIPPQFRHGNDGDLSPLAEKLLISAGSIGIFVIFGAIIYLVIRMKKLNRLARGEISEEEARWYGWRRNRGDPDRPLSYASGKVSQNGYPIDEKFAEREMGGFYNSDNKSSLERPGSATVNLRELRTDLQRQNSTRSSHSGSGMSASPVAGPGQSYGPPSNMDYYYSQTGTIRSQHSALSGQSSNAYDPSQREVNHMSYLSSISSGFGDSLVMPDDSAPPQIPVSRFSWTTASQGAPQNRDTIYTTTSEETAPRFRTVNSWVAQQTGRVERKQQSDMEIPAMPEIPISYTHRSQVPEPLFAEGHQRKMSENPAFRHHPGDEIELGRGSRVPSSILDRKMGI